MISTYIRVQTQLKERILVEIGWMRRIEKVRVNGPTLLVANKTLGRATRGHGET